MAPDSRKRSHSAIERRRRERINDEIETLREIVPGARDGHKLDVLRCAVRYIRELEERLVRGESYEREGSLSGGDSESKSDHGAEGKMRVSSLLC